ncbi:MAG: sensor histidine kinase, partial [Planctomycetota bacterium]
MKRDGFLGSGLGFGLLVLVLLATAAGVVVFVRRPTDPAVTRPLTKAARRAIGTRDWGNFEELARLALSTRSIRAVRCLVEPAEVLVSLPRKLDWESARGVVPVRLGDGIRIDILPASQSRSASWLLGLTIGGAVVLGTLLLWMQVRLVGPFGRLRRLLPKLGSKPELDSSFEGAPREIRELAADLRRFVASHDEKARTSQANFLALELAFEQLHAVLNSLGEGVIVSDPSGELVMANPIAREILGIQQGVGDADTVLDLFPEKERERMRSAMLRASRHLQTVLIEDLYIGAQIYNLSVAPIRDSFGSDKDGDGHRHDRAVAMVFLDMTEFHELNRMKDEFLSSVSHELRTPLTSIRSFSEILLQMTPEDKDTWTEFLGIVNTEAERLTRLVNDVLDLSRIEAGRMQFLIEPVEVSPQLKKVASLFTHLVRAKEAEIVVRCDAELPAVDADRDRLHQVLTNLLGNACKFLPRGGKVQ